MGTQQTITREPFFYTKYLWRFATGAHMDGNRHSDATWTKAATDRNGRLNKWVKMPRLKRAFIRWFSTCYIIGSIVAYIWVRDLLWLMTGLVLAYWMARFAIWFDYKFFHHYHVQDSEGNYTTHRAKHHRVQKRIDQLPDPVAKLFGGKTEL